jgi:hypothetical protein
MTKYYYFNEATWKEDPERKDESALVMVLHLPPGKGFLRRSGFFW